MTENAYQPPVSQLLASGDCLKLPPWPEEPNYLQLGFGPEHIPDLIRMMLDEALFWGDSESLEVWAPIHAWRTLGELRAEAAIEPLLGLLHYVDDDGNDWVGEEIPDVLGFIGPAAIPALKAYLTDPAHGCWACVTAASALEKITERYPEAMPACIATLTGVLETYADNDRIVNAFIISGLLNLKAVSTAQLMERAFTADAVDLSVNGDWEEVQIALGWKIARETPIPEGGWIRAEFAREEAQKSATRAITERAARKPEKSAAKANSKTKRKQANKSRQKNRKR